MSEDIYLDSEILSGLRAFLEIQPSLVKLTGHIAQFKVVIDANMAVADLIHKYEKPHIKQTAIEEAVKSSAVELYAPTWLNTEMLESTIPQVAKRRNLPEPALLELWAEYKNQIIWDDSYSIPEDAGSFDGDAKDVPYVALQKSIEAVAILSRDKDIEKLGGNRAELEFIFSVRSYARAATYSVGIRVSGVFITNIGIHLLTQIAKGIGSLVSRMPKELKIALLVLAIVLVVHPGSRERMIKFLKNLGEHITDLWPEFEKLVDLTTKKHLEAEDALEESQRLLGS